MTQKELVLKILDLINGFERVIKSKLKNRIKQIKEEEKRSDYYIRRDVDVQNLWEKEEALEDLKEYLIKESENTKLDTGQKLSDVIKQGRRNEL